MPAAMTILPIQANENGGRHGNTGSRMDFAPWSNQSSGKIPSQPCMRLMKREMAVTLKVLSVFVSLACTASAFSAGLNFAGAPLTPGGTVRVSVPLSELEKSYLREGGNAVPPYSMATLAVPPGFDPKKTWPMLIVFSSSDHLYPNWYDLMVHYRRIALAEGWVLLAGDGPTPPPRLDSSGWR